MDSVWDGGFMSSSYCKNFCHVGRKVTNFATCLPPTFLSFSLKTAEGVRRELLTGNAYFIAREYLILWFEFCIKKENLKLSSGLFLF